MPCRRQDRAYPAAGDAGIAVAEADVKATGTRKRGDFIPPGYSSCIEALTDVIRFGPKTLSQGEFLALLYHVERSLTYKKSSDATSMTQMVSGVVDRKNDRWIRGGSGLGRSAAISANTQLADRGLLNIQTRSNPERGCLPNRYAVMWDRVKQHFNAFRDSSPLVHNIDTPVHEADRGESTKWTVPRSTTGLAPVHETNRYRGNLYRDHHHRGKRTEVCQPHSSPEASVGSSATPLEKTKTEFTLKVDDDEAPKTEDEAKKRVSDLIGLRRENHTGHILGNIARKFHANGWSSFWIEYCLRVLSVTTPTKAGGGHYVSVAQTLIDEKKAELLERRLALTSVTETRVITRCEHCNEERGKGCILEDGRFLPCPHCATLEWIAHLEEKENRRLQRAAQQPALSE